MARLMLRYAAFLLAFSMMVGALVVVVPVKAGEVGFEWVVAPRFEDAGSAFDGVVPVKEGGKWGLISTDGEWVVRPTYEAVGAAGNGHLAVRKKGKWGFIDARGRVAIDIKYDEVRSFGTVIPVKQGKKWIVLDRSGARVGGSDFRFDKIAGSEGACVTGYQGSTAYIATADGQPALARVSDADKIFAPSQGLALSIDDDRRGWVRCGSGGHAHISHRYEQARKFSQGLAATKKDGRWGFISQNDIVVVGFRYEEARDFSEGFAPVKHDNGLWGYINLSGKEVIPAKFERAYGFSEGLAGVRMGEKRGFIDTAGNYAIKPQFDDFWKHASGVLPVKKDGKWGIGRPGSVGLSVGRGKLSIPIAALTEKANSVRPSFETIPSTAHYYHAQDLASNHKIAFSPDRRLMVTTLNENVVGSEVAIWDLEKRTLLRKLKIATAARSVILPGSKLLAVAHRDGTLSFWSSATGDQLYVLTPFQNRIYDLLLSDDNRYMAATDGRKVLVWSLKTGELIRKFEGRYYNLRFSKDGKEIAAGSKWQGIAIWDLASGKLLEKRKLAQSSSADESVLWVSSSSLSSVALSSRFELAYSDTRSERQQDGYYKQKSFIVVLNAENEGRKILDTDMQDVLSILYSSDGRYLYVSGTKEASSHVTAPMIDKWDTKNGEIVDSISMWTWGEITRYEAQSKQDDSSVSGWIDQFGLMADDRTLVVVDGQGEEIGVWDVKTGKKISALGHALLDAYDFAASFSDDMLSTISAGGMIATYDLESGKLAHYIDTKVTNGGEVLLEPSADGNKIYMLSGYDDIFHAYDVRTAERLPDRPDIKQIFDFRGDGSGGQQIPAVIKQKIATLGDQGSVAHEAFAGGRLAAFWEFSGIIKVWNLETGELAATILSSSDGEWVILTPEGFFNASPNGASLLNVVRGLESYSIDQVYQQLYRPDLVREKLAGDPNGKVAAAAAKLSFSIILGTGLPPTIRIKSPVDGASSADQSVTVEAEVIDEGGGVGKVEWRINGTTVEDVSGRGALPIEESASPGGAAAMLRATLALEPGDNDIELVVYNEAGLIASVPQSVTVRWDRVQTTTPPTLYVLAIGVNDYDDGALELRYAVPDALAIGEALRQAGKPLYSAVNVTTVLNTEVTAERLDAVFSQLRDEVGTQDVFVFFVAGHGKTLDGSFYFMPRDFHPGGDDAVRKGAIDQEQWQSWFKRIPARKSVLIFDACESGSLVDSGTRGLTRVLEESAAVAKLKRATGRWVLAATTDSAPALEGYRGHGVFTYAILQGIGAADQDGNAMIEVSELTNYIEDVVPELSQELSSKHKQTPRPSRTGNNFTLGAEVDVLEGAAMVYPKTSSHVVSGGAVVRAEPRGDADSVVTVESGSFYSVYVIEETADGWAIVAKGGNKLGFVRADSLSPLQ